jgi:hypothetical protein
MKKVAPALILSLKILSLAGVAISGIKIDPGDLVGKLLDSTSNLAAKQIKNMQIAVTGVIKDDSGMVQRIYSGKLNDSDVKILNDDALQLIAEKAMEKHKWKGEMVQVRLKNSTATLWVMKKYSKRDEYLPITFS